jgi:DNA-directed RNA polymerase specialized sigma24 family protein
MPIERELVERARSSAGAMERLIERVWPQAYRLAWGILRDRGLAEDAAQEACAAIAASLSGLHDAGAFAS